MELNGTYESTDVGNGHQSPAAHSQSNKSQLENGMTETDTPHGSVTGSNGYILSKQQQQEGGRSATGTGLAASPHRTNWLPMGTAMMGHITKTLPSPAAGLSRSLGALRTDTSTGTTSGQGATETETKNGPAPAPPHPPPPPPVTIHRARKTMSRPASNQTLKVTVRREGE